MKGWRRQTERSPWPATSARRTWKQGLFEVQGGYREFLSRKDEALAGQAAYQDSLQNKVRGELEWLSRKARARTRKAQARIDVAFGLVDELADLRARGPAGNAGLEFTGSARKTRELLRPPASARRSARTRWCGTSGWCSRPVHGSDSSAPTAAGRAPCCASSAARSGRTRAR